MYLSFLINSPKLELSICCILWEVKSGAFINGGMGLAVFMCILKDGVRIREKIKLVVAFWKPNEI